MLAASGGRAIDSETLLDVHRALAWVAIAGNGAAGAVALLAWRVARLRGRWLWALTAAAEAVLVVQVTAGALALSDEAVTTVPDFHTFYGVVGVLTVGLAHSYRSAMRGRLEMFYGLVGLFLMGLALRALAEL